MPDTVHHNNDRRIRHTPKYGFTGREQDFAMRKVREIVALCDFGTVKKGDVGGWVESEDNLSHENTCWLGRDCYAVDRSRIRGDALISGSDVRLFDDSQVDGNAVLSGANIGLFESSHIGGYTIISGSVIALRSSSQIAGNAIVSGSNITLWRKSQIAGNAIVSGLNIKSWGMGQIAGNAIISGSDMMILNDCQVHEHAAISVNGVWLRNSVEITGKHLLDDGADLNEQPATSFMIRPKETDLPDTTQAVTP